MSMFDDLEHKAQDVMNNPEQRAKIEQIARDKGMSLEDAKAYFLKTKHDNNQDSPAQ